MSDPSAVLWRVNMSAMFTCVFTPIVFTPFAKDCVLMLAAQIGETEMATNHILPMIDRVRAE
jgi:hypothetical protein